MATPRVLVLRAPGTNCDFETAHAFERAGAETQRIHINRILENPDLMKDFLLKNKIEHYLVCAYCLRYFMESKIIKQ